MSWSHAIAAVPAAASVAPRDTAVFHHVLWLIVAVSAAMLFAIVGIAALVSRGDPGVMILSLMVAGVTIVATPAITVTVIERIGDVTGHTHGPQVSGGEVIWFLAALFVGEAIALTLLHAPQSIPVAWLVTGALIGGSTGAVLVCWRLTEPVGIHTVIGMFAAIAVGMLIIFAFALVGRALARARASQSPWSG